MKPLLVLRPEPGASATVRRAEHRGLKASALPLFEIEALSWEAPEAGSFDGLLLTSANAVRHGGEGLRGLRGLPVYAVGQATAAAAREAGFDIRSIGESDVDRLLGSIDPDLRLLHLCGEDRTPPGAAAQAITAVPVYRAVERDVPLHDVRDCVALIHSPRAGRRFAERMRARATVAIAAISPAAADAAGEGWAEIAAAEQPTDEALLALAARLCNTPQAK